MMSNDVTKTLGVVLIALCVGCATATVAAQETTRDDLLGKRMLRLINSSPLKVADSDDELVKILKARHNVALQGLKESYKDFTAHITQADAVFESARRLVDSRLDVAQTPEERLEVQGQVLDILRELERIYVKRTETLGGGESELIRIRFARLTTEAEILKARRAMSAMRAAAN